MPKIPGLGSSIPGIFDKMEQRRLMQEQQASDANARRSQLALQLAQLALGAGQLGSNMAQMGKGVKSGFSVPNTPLNPEKDWMDKMCFISTAASKVLGWEDKGPEMNALREFRDTYMQDTQGRKAEIDRYYEIGPKIVKAIEASPDAGGILREIASEYLMPALSAIEAGWESKAHNLYRDMVLALSERFLKESVGV